MGLISHISWLITPYHDIRYMSGSISRASSRPTFQRKDQGLPPGWSPTVQKEGACLWGIISIIAANWFGGLRAGHSSKRGGSSQPTPDDPFRQCLGPQRAFSRLLHLKDLRSPSVGAHLWCFWGATEVRHHYPSSWGRHGGQGGQLFVPGGPPPCGYGKVGKINWPGGYITSAKAWWW